MYYRLTPQDVRTMSLNEISRYLEFAIEARRASSG